MKIGYIILIACYGDDGARLKRNVVTEDTNEIIVPAPVAAAPAVDKLLPIWRSGNYRRPMITRLHLDAC